MEEKELKTSLKHRIFIIIIAVIMLGSIIAGYAAIIMNGGGSQSTTSDDTESEIDEAKVAEYEEAYEKKVAEFAEKTKSDYDKFIKYKSEVKGYNETSANEDGLKTRDLKEGDGKTLTSEDTDYLAYYVGWCADETVFDSSFDDNDNPTGFKNILDASLGMIEGWNLGVDGMKINGIREITIPGELAYGDSMEICGGTNKPLKFIVMTKAKEGSLKTIAAELEEAYMRVQYAQYGIDYDSVSQDE